MTSGLPSTHQPFASPQPAPVPATTAAQATSPPTKANLKSWWKGFSKTPAKSTEKQGRYCHFHCSRSLSSSAKLFKPELPPNLETVFQEGRMSADTPIAEGTPSEVLNGVETEYRLSLSERPQTPPSHNVTKKESSSSILGDRSNKSLLSGSSGSSGTEENKPFSCMCGNPFGRAKRRSTIPHSNENESLSGEQTNALASSMRRKTFCSAILRPKTSLFSSEPIPEEPAKLIIKIVEQPTGIFGVPLRQSITYANVAISLVDAEGKSYIYGYVPIVVAKCGVYLKEKATNVEGIFRLSGSEKRIKELRLIFDSPDRYGKGLDWAGYTVHDAANVLRRYLNQLPEPIVPLDLYDRFREPLRGHTMQVLGDTEGPQFQANFDVNKAITTYQQLITELPPLNRQLLLYILDLLAVFASKSDENRMNSQNLAAIFQPGMLSHPQHDMAPVEYRLSQDVLIFLIENQDHFLIGMRGTAADEQTVQEVQNGGTPPPGTPTTPIPGRSKTTVARSASNGSAGAESVRKFGGIRRNVSVSSRHSRQSNGAPSPASPSLTQTTSSGVHRSNTVPSKKSPALQSSRLQKSSGSPPSPSPPTAGLSPNANAARGVSPIAPVASTARSLSSSSPGLTPTAPSHFAAVTSQERLIPESGQSEVTTPSKEKNLTGLFNRSPTGESDKKAPNKLRKKRLPSSSNPSAQSSTHSLATASPALQPILSQDALEHPRLDNPPASENPILSNTNATPPATETMETTPRAEKHPLKPRLEESYHSSDKTLKPVTSPPSSLHSHSSFNDQSDLDQLEDPAAAAERREKRSIWRLSRQRRKDDPQILGNVVSPKKGSDNGAGASSSSVGSSARPRKSFTGDTVPVSSDPLLVGAHMQPSNENALVGEEKKGPIGWLKTKIEKRREEKEAKEDRNKSPDRVASASSSALASRGKSMDVKREETPEKVAEEPEQPPQ